MVAINKTFCVALATGAITTTIMHNNPEQHHKHLMLGDPLLQDARAHMANAAQRINEVASMVKNDPSRAGPITISALINGLDGQIDASLGTMFNIAHYATMGLPDPLANFILDPFFQSVTDGLDVLVGNIVGRGTDLAMSPLTGSLQKNIGRMIEQGQAFRRNTSKLARLNSQLSNTLARAGRAVKLDVGLLNHHIWSI